MIISQDELKRRSIVVEANDDGFRGPSYDLTVGEVVCPDGSTAQAYVIPPQGLVKIISHERVVMPLDCMGYVLVKTGLCNTGVLALNTGIVDPGFEGRLTSTLINFGKTEQYLSKGTVFSRLAVHRLDQPADVRPVVLSNEKVSTLAREQVVTYLSGSFLDISKTIEKAAVAAFDRYKATLLWAAPVTALAVSLMSVAANVGNNWVAERSYLSTERAAQTQARDALAGRIGALEDENRQLRASLVRLQGEIGRPSPTSPPSAVPPDDAQSPVPVVH